MLLNSLWIRHYPFGMKFSVDRAKLTQSYREDTSREMKSMPVNYAEQSFHVTTEDPFENFLT